MFGGFARKLERLVPWTCHRGRKSKTGRGDGRDEASVPRPFFTKDRLAGLGYEIGDFTYGEPRVLTWGEETTLKIGKFCSIADGVFILLGGNHRVDWVTTYPFSALPNDWPEAADITGHPSSNGDVIIGSDVWIGHQAIILSGVSIGDGAVVGARAVVTRNVPPYAIVVGNPATMVRKRFDDATIRELQRVKWWDWSIEKIRLNVHVLMSPNTRKIIDLAGDRDVRRG